MIAIGIAMVPGSRLGDLIGRKKVVLIGLSIFGLASLWCGLSPTADSVIAARIIQGFGAGLYFPVSFALVSNATTDAERPQVLGFLSGVAGIGTRCGSHPRRAFSTIGWRWVFFVNVPIAAAGVIWGAFQLKEQRDPELADKRIRDLDFLGIAPLPYWSRESRWPWMMSLQRRCSGTIFPVLSGWLPWSASVVGTPIDLAHLATVSNQRRSARHRRHHRQCGPVRDDLPSPLCTFNRPAVFRTGGRPALHPGCRGALSIGDRSADVWRPSTRVKGRPWP